MATLLPEVNELVQANEAALVLLSHEIGSSCSTGLFRADQNHIELLVLFEGRRHLDLKLVSEKLGKFSLEVSLQSRQIVSRL